MPKIIAKMCPDWLEPYKTFGYAISVVVYSDHPKYKIRSRFDWGFIQEALKDGYDVEIRS